MPKSERHASTPRLNDLTAVVLAGIIALAVLAAAVAFGLQLQHTHDTSLRLATRASVRSIGASIALSVERAVGYGIPMPELYGVEDYFNQILRSNDEIVAISIVDNDGKALFTARDASSPPQARPVAVPIELNGQRQGTVLLMPSYRILSETRTAFLYAAGAAILLAALVVGVAMRWLLVEVIDLRKARFVAVARTVVRGRFRDESLPRWDTPLVELIEVAYTRLNEVRGEARAAATLAEEIRAVDFDGSLAARVSRAIAPLGSLAAFTPVSRPRSVTFWPGWWALPVLALAGATRPILSGFAADRMDDATSRALEVAASLGTDAAGRLLGLLVALLVVRGRPAVIAFGLAIASVVMAMGSESRGAVEILWLRFFLGFGTWLAVWTLIGFDGGFIRRPWRTVLILLAGEAIGPAIANFASLSFGRRGSMDAMSACFGVLFLAALSLRGRSTHRWTIQVLRGDIAKTAGLALAAGAAVAWIEVAMSAGIPRDNNPLLAFAYALFGCGLAILPLLRPAKRELLATTAAALAGAGLAMALMRVEGFPLAALLVGIGLGGAIVNAGGRALVPIGGIGWIAAALLAAGAIAIAALAGSGTASAAVGLTALAAVSFAFGALRKATGGRG